MVQLKVEHSQCCPASISIIEMLKLVHHVFGVAGEMERLKESRHTLPHDFPVGALILKFAAIPILGVVQEFVDSDFAKL